jgi:predicted nicotinamide N-methyase
MPTDTRREINPAHEAASALSCDTAHLPPLPCGWTVREYAVGGSVLKLTVPDRPDELLETPEVLAANDRDDYMPYWAYLWPAAIYMSQAVAKVDWPKETSVLELGCGVGLVGLAACAKGCRVTMTDYESKAVAVAQHNARLNGFDDVIAFELDWRTPPSMTFPVILGCDLLYEQRNHVPILDLLEIMLEPGGVCWLADGGRNVAHQFWYLARERGYAVTMFDAEGREIMTPGFHYQLFQLKR